MRAVTVTEFAKERRVSRARVYQWLEDGRVKRLGAPGSPEHGMVDADAAHAALGEHLDQAKGIRRDGNVTSQAPAQTSAQQPPLEQPAGDPVEAMGQGRPGGGDRRPDAGGRDDAGYWESRSRREAADALTAEMKAMQLAGGLVSAAGVRREIAALARATRNALLSIPDRVAPVVDPANPARAHKLLTDEISKALRELTARLGPERAAADSGAAEPERALQ